MLAKALLQYHVAGDEVVPHWLDASDHPWLAELIEAIGDFTGRRWGDWHDRKRRGWAMTAPAGKRSMAVAVLERSFGGGKLEGPRPRQIRSAVFSAAESTRGDPDGREHALQAAGEQLGLPVEAVERGLFADLPAERPMVPRDELPGVGQLVDRINLALAQGLLRQSVQVQLTLRGNARSVVRQVLLRRLIAVARPAGDAVTIEISGVYDLFRRTTLYGRALASVLPLLAWAPRYRLEAELVLEGRSATLTLTDRARLPAVRQPKPYDSTLEARFARDVRKQLPDWELLREPIPIEVDGTLVFPDFELRHRSEPSRSALVEIVGFWTRDYLIGKAGRLERCGRKDLVLCVDEARCADAQKLAPSLAIVPFKRRIDPSAVVLAIEGLSQSPASTVPTSTRCIEVRDLFIDFAGRQPPTDPLHDVLEGLGIGDPVDLTAARGQIRIVAAGREVGRLGRGGNRRHLPHVGNGTVARVKSKVRRRAAQSAPAFRGRLQCPTWWLIEVEYADAEAPEHADPQVLARRSATLQASRRPGSSSTSAT